MNPRAIGAWLALGGVRGVYLRCLGLIYLAAFLSMGVQVRLLVGARGLDPVAPKIEAALERGVGVAEIHANPTLFWIAASDGALVGVCVLGCVAALLLGTLVAPRAALALLWALYLSLATACGEYLAFQWDNLLLETAFFSFFYAPPGLRPFAAEAEPPPPHPAARFLVVWLAVRLHVESGLAKWTFGDPNWRLSHLTAMVDYYETAPLPTWVGWYVHQLPRGAHVACAAFTLAVEFVAPWFLFGPRWARWGAVALLAAFHASIQATANYCIFNVLSVVLCLPALECTTVPWRARWLSALVDWRGRLFAAFAAGLFLLTIQNACVRVLRWELPPVLEDVERTIGPFRTIHSYHLFAHLTLTRPEVELQGSDDGRAWKAYDFHYKPGDLTRAPAFVAPHQPRVDFRLWFVARLVPRPEDPGAYRVSWADRAGLWNQITGRLAKDPAAVAPLFRVDPFSGRAPRYLRLVIWHYRMTDLAERHATGRWWKRTEVAVHPYVHDTTTGDPPRF